MTGRRGRRSAGSSSDVALGRRAAVEAARSGNAAEVLVAHGARPSQGLREVLDAARRAGVPVRRVPPGDLDALAAGERHQGVAARVRLPPTLTEGGLGAEEWAADAVVLVADGVMDPHNLGALARTAEAAGAAALVARRNRGAGLTPAAVRASAGALLHLPVAHVPNLRRALDRLKRVDFWVVGLDTVGEVELGEAERPPGRLALVVGSEGAGLSRLVREACDELVRIPMRGRVRSLNVSVAAGVALFGYALRLPRSTREGGVQ